MHELPSSGEDPMNIRSHRRASYSKANQCVAIRFQFARKYTNLDSHHPQLSKGILHIGMRVRAVAKQFDCRLGDRVFEFSLRPGFYGSFT